MLFQILFYDLAHGLKRTNKHLLDAHFRALPRTEIPALRRTPLHDPPADPQASSGDTGGELLCQPRPLLNPSNYCYVNALLSALIPTRILTAASAPAAALHRELLSTGQTRPLNAVASFALRTLTPRWRYDGQQQDSSEFLLTLFRGLSEMPITRSWAKRDPLTGEHLDGGGPLILLPAPSSHTRLQALITSWHTEQLNVALTDTQAVAVLQVARFAEGSKLSYSLSGVHFALNLPTWERRNITWRAGWVQACSIARSGAQDRTLRSTDDGRVSATASESDMRQNRQGSYLLFGGRSWPR